MFWNLIQKKRKHPGYTVEKSQIMLGNPPHDRSPSQEYLESSCRPITFQIGYPKLLGQGRNVFLKSRIVLRVEATRNGNGKLMGLCAWRMAKDSSIRCDAEGGCDALPPPLPNTPL
ncbi:hypothetical protein J6590_083550 [Homalodisca vitripennis]|nr:hypothetical protein J6590_083550 [Homalodisca vitripennis]